MMIVESIFGNDGDDVVMDDVVMDDDIASLRYIELLQDIPGQIWEPWEFVAWSDVVDDNDGQVTSRNMK